ncbi:hypothetical protein GCM10023215_61970 [Pseudonocardia yuanmonensis]|uniref:Uncharacterized protein n=1 Tax=Pseudonocardia yuanmonensis TaxID=1095914 RepID=A0ABP8XRF2_9PSEU
MCRVRGQLQIGVGRARSDVHAVRHRGRDQRGGHGLGLPAKRIEAPDGQPAGWEARDGTVRAESRVPVETVEVRRVDVVLARGVRATGQGGEQG